MQSFYLHSNLLILLLRIIYTQNPCAVTVSRINILSRANQSLILLWIQLVTYKGLEQEMYKQYFNQA